MVKEIKIYEQGKIDIHNRKAQYEARLEKLKKNTSIISENKVLILEFVRDCELGKTVKGKAKKKIGPARCHKYLTILTNLSDYFNKPFEQVTQEDMENFISDLENDRYRKSNDRCYSDETKVDYKKSIKKFWKWWQGKNQYYPEIVEWIETFIKEKEISSITKADIESMINQTGSLRNKALLMVLFDSGARIEELLNVRLKKEHLFWNDQINCYLIRLEFSKTKPRTVSIPLCTKYINDWLDVHPAKENEQAQLFPVNYCNIVNIIQRLGKKVLNKRVYPHLLRHSSATYYANKIKSPYKLCYRYGWTMASKMVNRYIDRAGINDIEIAETVKEDEILTAKKERDEAIEDFSRLKENHEDMAKDMNYMKEQQYKIIKMFGEFLDKVAEKKGIDTENNKEELIKAIISN